MIIPWLILTTLPNHHFPGLDWQPVAVGHFAHAWKSVAEGNYHQMSPLPPDVIHSLLCDVIGSSWRQNRMPYMLPRLCAPLAPGVQNCYTSARHAWFATHVVKRLYPWRPETSKHICWSSSGSTCRRGWLWVQTSSNRSAGAYGDGQRDGQRHVCVYFGCIRPGKW